MTNVNVKTTVSTSASGDAKVAKKRKFRQPSNRIPNAIDELNTKTHDMLAGLEDQQADLGIPESTGPNLKAALISVENSQAELHGIIAVRGASLQPALTAAEKEGKVFIQAAKKIVKIQLGDTWNTKWLEAGFLKETTIMPRTQAERDGLVKVLAKYLAADPKREAENQGVTAARAEALHATIVNARKELSDNKAAQKRAKGQRDKAVRHLRRLIRGLVLDLETALEPGAAEWSQFGLIAPAQLKRRKRGKKEGEADSVAPRAAQTESETVVALAK